MNTDTEDKKLFGEMFKQINSRFYRCFWPKHQCTTKGINAHSIQNSGVLDLICSNNHVVMPQMKIDIDSGPSVIFKEVGRNKATTFTGLCDVHDNELFRPIDKEKFDEKNVEHLFLLSYRSVLRELHAKMKAAVDVQTQYSKGVELGRFDPNISNEPMMMATIALVESYSFYRYKFSFDTIYRKKSYDEMEHKIEFFNDLLPSVAVSTVYSNIDNIKSFDDRDDPKCISLNIFPCDNGVYVIFSYRKAHRAVVLSHIERIFEGERHYKLYLISKIILMYCENFVISPEIYNSFSETKKQSIVDFFSNNILANKNDAEDLELYLFSQK